MNCPACDSTEIDGNGLCLKCGHAAAAQAPVAPSAESGVIMEASEGKAPEAPSEDALEVPEWRQELSRRLQEIKLKREAAAVAAQDQTPPVPEEPAPPVRTPAPRRSRRVTAFPNRERVPEVDRAGQPDPAIPIEAEVTADSAGAATPLPAAEVMLRPPAAVETDQHEIKKLIDSVMSRYAQDEPPADPLPCRRLPHPRSRLNRPRPHIEGWSLIPRHGCGLGGNRNRSLSRMSRRPGCCPCLKPQSLTCRIPGMTN